MISGVAFDLDDTLYPEKEFVYSGYRAVSEFVRQQLGVKIYEDLVMLFEAGARGDLFTPVLSRQLGDIEESYVRKLVEVYREHTPVIHPFPEAQSVLGELGKTYRLAIISDGWLGMQERKLHGLGIRHAFDAVVFSDKWGKRYWKPHRRPYEECAHQLSLEPATMVYIGDNPIKDFIAPRLMGMRTIRVRRSGTLHYRVCPAEQYDAEFEVSDLSDILGLLKTMEER